jgi:hypothetical protein
MKKVATDENNARGGPYLQILEDEGSMFFETSGTDFPVTWHHGPEERIPVLFVNECTIYTYLYLGIQTANEIWLSLTCTISWLLYDKH